MFENRTYVHLSSYRHNSVVYEQGCYTCILNSTALTTAIMQHKEVFYHVVIHKGDRASINT